MTFVTGRDFKKQKIHSKITKSEMAKFRLFAFFPEKNTRKTFKCLAGKFSSLWCFCQQ